MIHRFGLHRGPPVLPIAFGQTRKSKLLRDTRLSQHRVGGVAGQDLPVHRKTPFRDRAVPDFMVTSARALKVTSMRAENLLKRGV
jgi:hypothetical protein